MRVESNLTMEKILYRMCAYTHSDQFGKITVDRGFVDLAVVTGRVLESFWVHPEPRHGVHGVGPAVEVGTAGQAGALVHERPTFGIS